MSDAAYTNQHDDEPLPAAGYRTYEVFQRERVGETTNLVSPRELVDDEMLTDPYRALGVLRENYPCYRDWKNNRFWLTRYDDVTSVFVDDANFETRPKRSRIVGSSADRGRDLWSHVAVLDAHATRIDDALDIAIERCLADLTPACDLATEFAARLPLELWGAVLDLDAEQLTRFAALTWRLQRGLGWDPVAQVDATAAWEEMVDLVTPLFERRRHEPGDDLISAIARLDLGERPPTPTDVVATVVEADHETLHGGLANLWCLLLTHREQLDRVRADPRLMKFAWLEALRHSPPVQSAERYARREVERFGRLLPDGALVHLSAAAANRDPRAFSDPDDFVVGRRDLCQREPRGQYRADGLPSGIAFGMGKPSIHPAVPKERPRSIYAITRDVAVAASTRLLERWPVLDLADGAEPTMRSLRLGEMYTCWRLPVRLR
ncbi:cytochrome P450 [Ilumatobacter coccineus]|uniref:cytochrome P450 n=1 Tax=Ilumatobacter coccineus TaxID=467094 RepID=UPI00059C7772|nr:cytochrome P450 [Ilumatobacter coccineus]